jgi:hypothetical protein
MFGYCCKCNDGSPGYSGQSGSVYSSPGQLSGCGCIILPTAWRVTSDAWSQFSVSPGCGLCSVSEIQNVLCDDYFQNCNWRKVYGTCAEVGVGITATKILAAFSFTRIGGGGSTVVSFEATKASLGISDGDPCLGPYLLPYVTTQNFGALGGRWCQGFSTPFNNEVTVEAA